MIGDKDLDIQRESQSTDWLVDLVRQAAKKFGDEHYFFQQEMEVEDDHLPFVKRGVPSIDVIDLDYGPNNSYHHTAQGHDGQDQRPQPDHRRRCDFGDDPADWLAMIQKLVLLPGMDGTGELFADFVNALPDEFEAEIVRYPADVILSDSELMSLVNSASPSSESFVLVAESFSAPLAIQYVATNPRNLKGLVLCAGFAASPVRGLRRFLCSLMSPILLSLPLPELIIKFLLVGPNANPPLVSAVREAVASVLPKVLLARLRAVFHVTRERS